MTTILPTKGEVDAHENQKKKQTKREVHTRKKINRKNTSTHGSQAHAQARPGGRLKKKGIFSLPAAEPGGWRISSSVRAGLSKLLSKPTSTTNNWVGNVLAYTSSPACFAHHPYAEGKEVSTGNRQIGRPTTHLIPLSS